MNNIIDIEYNLKNYEEEAPIPLVEKMVNDVLSYFSKTNVELSISFVSDDEIQELNKVWRNKDMPTDILSFVQADNVEEIEFWPSVENDSTVLGDLIISLEAIKRNCINFNVQFDEELDRILIHGVLHLLGYDHKTNDSLEPMLLLQEKILSNIREQ
ncbi:MAG: rRNA maturation RNase YbeY [Pleomorphochaeta sp.]